MDTVTTHNLETLSPHIVTTQEILRLVYVLKVNRITVSTLKLEETILGVNRVSTKD